MKKMLSPLLSLLLLLTPCALCWTAQTHKDGCGAATTASLLANASSHAVATPHGNAHEESSINVCRNVALVNEFSPAMVGLTSATNGLMAHVYDSTIHSAVARATASS